MKNILFVLVGLIFLSFLSCRSSDDEITNPLVGKWVAQKYNYSYIYQGEAVSEDEFPTVCQQRSTVEFRADNKGTETYYDENENGVCGLIDQSEFSYSYNASAGTISVSYPDGTSESLKVESLVGNQMVLSSQFTEDGILVTVKLYMSKI